MAELFIELLALTTVIVLLFTWYFYVYPAMKKEYERNRWTWRRYYKVCGDDNRLSYREHFTSLLKAVKRKTSP